MLCQEVAPIAAVVGMGKNRCVVFKRYVDCQGSGILLHREELTTRCTIARRLMAYQSDIDWLCR